MRLDLRFALSVLCPFILLTLGVPQPLTALTPGSAEGSFTVDDQSVTLRHAYAAAQPDTFDETKEEVVLLLTDRPLTAAAVLDPFARMRLDEVALIEVTIGADGTVTSTSFRHPGLSMGSLSVSSTDHQLELTTRDESAVAGKFFVAAPTSIFDQTLDFSVTFSAAIARQPTRVEPTAEERAAAAASAPAAAFAAHLQALTQGDVEALRQSVTAENAAMMEGPDFKEQLELIQLMTPTEVAYERLTVDGDDATLEVTGSRDGEKLRGTVTMVLEGGAWKVGKQSWRNE